MKIYAKQNQVPYCGIFLVVLPGCPTLQAEERKLQFPDGRVELFVGLSCLMVPLVLEVFHKLDLGIGSTHRIQTD